MIEEREAHAASNGLISEIQVWNGSAEGWTLGEVIKIRPPEQQLREQQPRKEQTS
jgi:hypothetical protein